MYILRFLVLIKSLNLPVLSINVIFNIRKSESKNKT
jgi:hypothetical protein